MYLKFLLNFFGIWSYPFGLAVSSLLTYFIQTMRMQEFVFDNKNIMGIVFGGLTAPFFVMISNLYDWLAKGTTDFTPNLTFKKNITMISDSKRQAMYKLV